MSLVVVLTDPLGLDIGALFIPLLYGITFLQVIFFTS